jgi:hypothetical protein
MEIRTGGFLGLTIFPDEEVSKVKCASCGEVILGTPVWVDDHPYCCEECADVGPLEEEIEQEEWEREETWEE